MKNFIFAEGGKTKISTPLCLAVLLVLLIIVTILAFIAFKTPNSSNGFNTPTRTPIAGNPVDLAKQDLNRTLNISLDKIIVLEVREVEWPDSSMGCSKPEEGASLPVVTLGWQIFLE